MTKPHDLTCPELGEPVRYHRSDENAYRRGLRPPDVSARYDLVVIGSGPAGEKGAAQAAYFGKRVALVERASYVGGAGVNTGTIPSKTLRETALYFSGLRQRGLYGIDYSLRKDITVADFMYREHAVVESERSIVRENLEKHGIELIHGEASLLDANTVSVRTPVGAQRELQTEIVLVATGSSPFHPPNIPHDDRLIYDSDTILRMHHMPKSMVLLGGGMIGCEYAALFAALGVDVTLVTTGSGLLPVVDSEIAERLRVHLMNLGMHFLFNDRVLTVERGDGVSVRLASGKAVAADVALVAAGRRSNIEGLGLEALGVELGERGLILVNERYQTSKPNIYAAGDVIGFPALASTAMEQARVAMVHAFDLRYKEAVSAVLPIAIYTIPEIAMVGLSEDACREKEIPYLVGRAYYAKSPRGQIIGDVTGMLKLVFSPTDKRLLGAHLIGELAAELIHLGAQVLTAGGGIDSFIAAVYNYPSLSDSYKYAAYDGLGNWQLWLKHQGSAAQ